MSATGCTTTWHVRSSRANTHMGASWSIYRSSGRYSQRPLPLSGRRDYDESSNESNADAFTDGKRPVGA